MDLSNKLFINGQFVDPVLGKSFVNYKPTTGEVLCNVAAATKEDVDAAVKAAKACLYSQHWGYASTGRQRATILRKLGEIIAARTDELARLDSLDHGKPLREALADMGDAVSACNYFAALAEEQDAKQDEVIDCGTGDFECKIKYEPIGVVAAITPWNYPFLMGIWKVIPALAAGCSIVLKSSELAPLSCLVLAQMCSDAGLPAGALNVLSGFGADAGAPLSAHSDVDKVSFTGSGPTGSKIMAAASNGPRAVSCELGGKSPLILFDDADLDSAVDWVVLGILWGSGQVCSATSRVLIHESKKMELIDRVVARFAAVKIGDTLSEEMVAFTGPQMGPVISKAQYDKIWKIIDDGKKLGCRVEGGNRETVAHLGSGFYIPPTLFIDPPLDSFIWNEEIFGPVLCIRSFSTEDEAVSVANNSEYGLAGAVFSADPNRCERVAKNLRVGIVWKNCCQPAFIQAPWGGVKKSGFGRDLGRWGLEEFTSIKQVTGCNPGFSFGMW